MESIEKINSIVGGNIAAYRKCAGMTQSELADKLGYSDKSVSKWEQGNGVPDIYNLMAMAEIFGVTVNDLISEHAQPLQAPKKKWLDFTNKNLIMALSSGVSWLIAVIVFVILKLVFPELDKTWLPFVYAIPVTAIVLLVLSCVWHFRYVRIISVTGLIWSLLLCIYLSFLPENYWMIFLIGIPLQIMTVFAFALAVRIGKNIRDKK